MWERGWGLSLSPNVAHCLGLDLPPFATVPVFLPLVPRRKKETSLGLYLLCHHFISAFEDNFFYQHFLPCKHDASMAFFPLVKVVFLFYLDHSACLSAPLALIVFKCHAQLRTEKPFLPCSDTVLLDFLSVCALQSCLMFSPVTMQSIEKHSD